jgi:hypothetical protein
MTTSGTYTFGTGTEAVDVIEEAWERATGKDASEMSALDLDRARRSLMFMFSDWVNQGPNLFEIYQLTIPLVSATQSYDLPTNTIYVTDGFTRQTINGVITDLVVAGISRTEYWSIPNKAQDSSRPNQFYLQRTITPTVYIYPVLQANDNTSCELRLNIMRMIQDVGNFANTLDAPQRAFDAMAAGLAVRLATKLAADRLAFLQPQSDAAYARFIGEDRERVPLTITVDASVWQR